MSEIHAFQDPTTRTLETVQREIEVLERLINTRLEAVAAGAAIRMELIRDTPKLIEEAVFHLQELQSEKFRAIDLRFVERDVRTEQSASAGAQALAAALQAAKELVGAQGEASAAAAVKSETSFTKQIDQIGALVESKDKATDARITELKERIDRGEGGNLGAKESRMEIRQNTTQTRDGIYLLLVGLAIAISIIMPLVLRK